MKSSKFTRRDFLRTTGLALVASTAPRFAYADAADTTQPMAFRYPNPGKIVIVHHPNAVLGYNNADYNVVQQMFDRGIMQFTGITTSSADALASLFPGLTTDKKIAIKPNIYNAVVPARKELAKAIVTRLVQMLGGFPAANITFYERHGFTAPGYTTIYFGQPVNLITDLTFPDLGYSIYCNGKNRPYSKSLHDADYLINLPVLKSCNCGTNFPVTLAFKNHMGTVNPSGTLGIHVDKKAVLDIMADDVMTTKQRIVITDCLFAMYDGGPSGSPQATPCKIMIAQDPVTSDYQGLKLINELRAANSLPDKTVPYIEEASKAPYEIGIADPALMNVIALNLPDGLGADDVTPASSWKLGQNYPNPFSAETEISLRIEKAVQMRIEVISATGTVVSVLHDAYIQPGLRRVRWDASKYATGAYLCRATADGLTKEIRMLLVK